MKPKQSQSELTLTLPTDIQVIEVASSDVARACAEIEAKGGWLWRFEPLGMGARWKLTVYPAARQRVMSKATMEGGK